MEKWERVDARPPEELGDGSIPIRPAADSPSVWVVVSRSRIPVRWRGRGMDAVVIPLLPAEAEAVLRGEPAGPALSPEDEQLLGLVARDLRVSAIAAELGISPRGLQHRLARLRRRFDVPTTADLAVLATRWGFGRE